MESKRLIREIITLELELKLTPEEICLAAEDHEFLATERHLTQADWGVNVANLPGGSAAPPTENNSNECLHDTDRAKIKEWVQSKWVAGPIRRNADAYFDAVIGGVTDALVELLLVLPLANESEFQSPMSALALWLIDYLRGKSTSRVDIPSADTASARPSFFFKTNYELMRTVDALKGQQREMHAQLEKLQGIHSQLRLEKDERNKLIEKLSVSKAVTRTAVIMVGTPFELDAQRHWIPPGCLLVPLELSLSEILGLRRAEQVLMESDERRWRALLRAQLEYDSSTLIQSNYRMFVARRAFINEMKARTRAAAIIQRNYFHYLYYRAIRLPRWCAVGREVIVAPSIAQKCAVSFQFYAYKDFPSGNIRRLVTGATVAELMAECREDERCAGFSTDGNLKRFVPRQLSQLKPMSETAIKDSPCQTPGLYIKVLPPRDDPSIVHTAIITAIPPDRFGLVEVAMDGLNIAENVPVLKLSDRWKRIRVKRRRDPRKPRAVVFGRAARQNQQNQDEGVVCLDDDRDIERVVDDDDDDDQTEGDNNAAEELETAFQDLTTQSVVVVHADDINPPRFFDDELVRSQEIAARRQAFEAKRDAEYAAKVLASAVKLQCAWRSKRARENLRRLLQLRVKEKEREQLVARVRVDHAGNKTSKSKASGKTTRSGGLFGKWRKGS